MAFITRLPNPNLVGLGIDAWGERIVADHTVDEEILDTDQQFAENSVPGSKITFSRMRVGVNRDTNVLFINDDASTTYPSIDVRRSVGTGSGIYVQCDSPAGYCVDVLQNSATPAIHAVSNNASSVAVPIQLEQQQVTSTNFYKVQNLRGASALDIDVWVANNANPNGTLTGIIGDPCFSTNGNIYICQGGTVWSAVAIGSGGDFGDGNDGDVTIAAGTTTLTRDMYYNNLTIDSGAILNPAGYHVFVKGTLTNNGTIRRRGNNGAAGTAGASGGTGGAGGAALASGTIFGSLAGKTGGNGAVAAASTAGLDGVAGTAGVRCLISGTAAGGGGGGAGGGPGGAGGLGSAGGGATASVRVPRSATYASLMTDTDFALLTGAGSAGSGGGGGSGVAGGGGQFGAGGGGGGSGSGGGVAVFHVKTWVNNGAVQLENGTGGPGGAGQSLADAGAGGGGGGGGGGAGHGGIFILVYGTMSGSGTVTTYTNATANGGAAGTGPGGNGVAGASGIAGLTGLEIYIQS